MLVIWWPPRSASSALYLVINSLVRSGETTQKSSHVDNVLHHITDIRKSPDKLAAHNADVALWHRCSHLFRQQDRNLVTYTASGRHTVTLCQLLIAFERIYLFFLLYIFLPTCVSDRELIRPRYYSSTFHRVSMDMMPSSSDMSRAG